MGTTQNLKFIHLSTGSASTHKADTGAIIFEKATGRIAVATGANTDVEYYGGGRVSDAKFEKSILTLSFNDGSEAITLDFSDVASTSGVNKILGKLRNDVDTISGRVTTLEGTVATNTTDIAAIKDESTGILADAKKYAEGLAKNYDAAGAAAKALGDAKAYTDGKVGDIGDGNVKDYVDTAKADAIKDAKSYTDGKVSEINTTTEVLRGDVDALKVAVGDDKSGLVKKVNTLVGTDADKSVRTISAEEVAKVVANAPEDFDTLKEIADWIANDTTDAAKMANDIAALKTTVGDDESGLVKKVNDNTYNISTNADAIKALQGLHASGKTVAQEVTDGIAGIPEASKSAGTDVVVTVKTKSGSVSAVEVNADVLAGKVTANTNAIANETERATDVEGKLRTDVNANAVAIKALQDAQAEGSLMWSVWD